ncbi:MAG: DNA methyltransferase [Bacillota bacterium]|nr:DNA methyltransferase [Bacillota bacterium]
MRKANIKANDILKNYLSEINQPASKSSRSDPSFKYIGDSTDEQICDTIHSIDWSFTNNDTTYLSHDIHPYPAKFIPQLPETLIKLFSQCGEMIWDPFGGSGTTALEALLSNRQCISTDINPIGEIIGKAKTATLTQQDEIEIKKFIASISQYSSNEQYLKNYVLTHQKEISIQIPDIPNINKWFSETVICELSFIKHQICTHLTQNITQTIAKASLSKLITRVSNQESETRYSAKEKNVPALFTLKLFIKDLEENLSKIKALSKLLGFKQSKFITTSVTENIVGLQKPIKNSEIDFVITSPPYPNAFDYHLYHRFRIFWLDGDPRTMEKAEIGSHLKYQKKHKGFEEFEHEMLPVLENCYKALKAGKYAVFILGDAIFNGILYKTADHISKLAESIGFKTITIVDRPIHDTKRSVQSAARRAKNEQILVLKKPDTNIDVTLIPVAYKMWPYEKVISDMEKDAVCGTPDSNKLSMPSNRISCLRNLTFYRGYQIETCDFKTWQAILENGNQIDEVTHKDPKYVTHGIHPYKGKFYPQLVKPLLSILGTPLEGVVFDPFCGSGTILLEAALNGYRAYGCDINPIAVEIARTKNEIIFTEPYEFERQISSFVGSLSTYNATIDYSNAFSSVALPEIQSWFPAPVVSKMGYIVRQVENIPDDRIKRFVRVILSSIIRDISQQEPSDLRIRRRSTPLQDAPVFDMLLQGIATQKERVLQFARIRNLAPCTLYEARAWQGNSKNQDLFNSIKPNSVDLVITSPPYATALPYIDTNRLNLLVLDGLTASLRTPIEAEMTGTREIKKGTRDYYERLIEEQNFNFIISESAWLLIQKVHNENSNNEVGFRRKNMAALLYMYFNDMTCVFTNLNMVVKRNGYICIVIGDTKTTTGEGLVIISTTKILRETGRALGWELVYDIPITVTRENYKHIGNSIIENNILIFKKIV